MHPAYSIIFFTTASGAGYGLLALLGALGPLGLLPAGRGFAAVALALALALITAGLAASALHLKHPERAWRALGQWRSSWLSREGVAALATYPPALGFAAGWLGFGELRGVGAGLGGAAAAGAVVTVGCTAMIYASLKPIRQWHTSWVPPVYLALALMTGALTLNALLWAFGAPDATVSGLAPLAVVLAWALKWGYWRQIDRGAAISTPESATGLGALGRVRLLDPPHTGTNYLMREMGFRVARKHAARLRRIAAGLGFAAPLALSLALIFATGPLAVAGAALAALLGVAGTLVERWLFFAEARHSVGLYYGAGEA